MLLQLNYFSFFCLALDVPPIHQLLRHSRMEAFDNINPIDEKVKWTLFLWILNVNPSDEFIQIIERILNDLSSEMVPAIITATFLLKVRTIPLIQYYNLI